MDACITDVQLDLLSSLARTISSKDLPTVLDGALDLMARHLKMMRGAITLVSPQSGEIRIQASYGLNAAEQERGRYLRGEGITGRVVESGRPMYVSNVSNEPLFLNKTQSRNLGCERISFLCVPITVDRQVIGALSVDQLLNDTESLKAELRLLEIIASMLAHAALEAQLRMDTETPSEHRPPGFVGNSSEMINVYEQIKQVARSQASVLLQGESGTGKELAARAIHAQSLRSKRPFISLNCAALPENLIESELFGHERGAFTGANSLRKGRFELADTGTLFLDEIGELTLPTQAKLLRVLQTLSFERVGGMQTQHVDVRVITATNRDLSLMVEEGSFRSDLYFRINVFPITLPPLRARRDDIFALCNHFLKKLSSESDPMRISFAAMQLLKAYHWPGNVRELENVLERAVLLAGNETLIDCAHLPKELQVRAPSSGQTVALEERLRLVEKEALTEALSATKGHFFKAAQRLGLTERKMRLRMQRHNLHIMDFRAHS